MHMFAYFPCTHVRVHWQYPGYEMPCRRVSKRGYVADKWVRWLAVRMMGSGSRSNTNTLPVLVVFVCASVVGEPTPGSVSSSSCSTSDPHTHCSSADLYTPNYTQQPHDSIQQHPICKNPKYKHRGHIVPVNQTWWELLKCIDLQCNLITTKKKNFNLIQ